MSLDRYRQSLAGMDLRPNEATWFPKWLAAYASDRQVKLRINPAGDVPVELDVIELVLTRLNFERRLLAQIAHPLDVRMAVERIVID